MFGKSIIDIILATLRSIYSYLPFVGKNTTTLHNNSSFTETYLNRSPTIIPSSMFKAEPAESYLERMGLSGDTVSAKLPPCG
jgi:hypothetical protein